MVAIRTSGPWLAAPPAVNSAIKTNPQTNLLIEFTSKPARVDRGWRKIPDHLLGTNLTEVLAKKVLFGEPFDTQGAGPIGFAPRVQVLVLSQNTIIVQVNCRLPDNAAPLFVRHHGQAKRRNDGIGAPDTPELQDHSETLRSGWLTSGPRAL